LRAEIFGKKIDRALVGTEMADYAFGSIRPTALATGPGDQDAAAVFEMLKTNATPPLTILRCIKAGCMRNRSAGVCAQVVIA